MREWRFSEIWGVRGRFRPGPREAEFTGQGSGGAGLWGAGIWGGALGGGAQGEAEKWYLELPQLLKLAAQVIGAVLQATQMQLHLQTVDGSGLPRRGAAGRGRGRAGHWGGPTAPAA